MKAVVSIDSLSVGFASDGNSIVHVLDNVSLSVLEGEVLGIVGESGSGKSTILRAILKLLPLNAHMSGQISFRGENIFSLSDAALSDLRGAKIAMVYQDPIVAFDPVFTVGEQICETVVRHQGISRKEAMLRARELLEMVQIPMADRRLQAYPHEMSGGMRQRAMIALALSCGPDVLLADEPTSALDLTVQMQIILLLKELQKILGMAMIFVTHDMGVAAEICDRMAVLYSGSVVEQGPITDVILAPSHPYTLGLLDSSIVGIKRGSRLNVIPGVPPDPSNLPSGCKFEPRCRYATSLCAISRPVEFEMENGVLHRCVRRARGEIKLPRPFGNL